MNRLLFPGLAVFWTFPKAAFAFLADEALLLVYACVAVKLNPANAG